MDYESFKRQVLLALARLGRLTQQQLFRVLTHTGPSLSLRLCGTRLQTVEQEELIRSEYLYGKRYIKGLVNTSVPQRMGKVYILTKRGEKYVHTNFDYVPYTSEKIIVEGRNNLGHQALHQRRLVDIILDLLQEAERIPGYVGCSCIPELQLGPTETPRCDAFLVVRRWNDATGIPHYAHNSIPWLLEPRIEQQQTDMTFALEMDNDTEYRDIIQKKARDYARVFREGWWRGRYKYPMPVFIVPSLNRYHDILAAWSRGWSDGFVMCTTLDQIATHGIGSSIWTLQMFDAQKNQLVARQVSIFGRMLSATLPPDFVNV